MINCTVCNETFMVINSYISHLTRHLMMSYHCPIVICNRNFPHIESLRSHLNRKHNFEETPNVVQKIVTTILNTNISDNFNFENSCVENLNESNFDLSENDVKNEILKPILKVYNENSFSRK